MAIRSIIIAYVLASVISLFFGYSIITATSNTIAARFIVHCVLGPLAFLAYMSDWVVNSFFYAVATALVAGCLALTARRNRPSRLIGYAVAAATWALSGYIMFLAHYLST